MKIRKLFYGLTLSVAMLTTAVLTTSCSNIKLPGTPEALETLNEVAELRTYYKRTRDNWESVSTKFDISKIHAEDQGAVVKAMLHLSNAFNHAETLVHDKNLDATGKTKALAEVPAFYNAAKLAVLDLKSVYIRNKQNFTEVERSRYVAIYNDLVVLDTKVQSNIATVENLDEWLKVVANFTNVLGSF